MKKPPTDLHAFTVEITNTHQSERLWLTRRFLAPEGGPGGSCIVEPGQTRKLTIRPGVEMILRMDRPGPLSENDQLRRQILILQAKLDALKPARVLVSSICRTLPAHLKGTK